MYFSFFIFFLSLILIFLNYIIGNKPKVSREKSSVFECGFDPSGSSRLPFSMHFFLVALIFLIFDVEISLMLPLPYSWSLMANTAMGWVTLSVLILLLAGALIEWAEGSLEWHS